MIRLEETVYTPFLADIFKYEDDLFHNTDLDFELEIIQEDK